VALTTLRRDGDIAFLGLNRPDKHNALDQAMVDELGAALLNLRRSPCIVVLCSETPGIFAAGADIAELLERDSDAGLRGINAVLFEQLEAHPWPTIAAIDGPALGGGCELAMACDFRLVSPRARFGQPELSLGIMAGAGGNWRLQQLVGLPLARRMLYAGETLDATAAVSAGLADGIHEPSVLLDEAAAYARRMAGRSWRALELTKVALRIHRPATTLYDMTAQALLFDSSDKRERMSRFLQERAARRGARKEAER
jgi:enoyl-CoA hydratase/carnithine racemase